MLIPRWHANGRCDATRAAIRFAFGIRSARARRHSPRSAAQCSASTPPAWRLPPSTLLLQLPLPLLPPLPLLRHSRRRASVWTRTRRTSASVSGAISGRPPSDCSSRTHQSQCTCSTEVAVSQCGRWRSLHIGHCCASICHGDSDRVAALRCLSVCVPRLRLVLLTDSNIDRLYGQTLLANLKAVSEGRARRCSSGGGAR